MILHDYKRQIEDEMLTEEHVISDDDEVDNEIMHDVSSLLNNEDNISNDLTDSIVNPRVIIYPLKANGFQASTTPHGLTTLLSINKDYEFFYINILSSSFSTNILSVSDDITSQNMNTTLTNVIEKLNLNGDNISEVENDKAKVLKNKLTNNSLKIYRDKLFLNSNSIGSFLTTSFDDLFDKNDIDVNISFKSSFEYSTSIENLEKLKMLYDLKGAFFSLLIILNDEYKQKQNKSPSQITLRGFVSEKMQSVLNIQARQERRHWRGVWCLIELLNLTRCPANILVEAGITAKFLMRSTVEEYDCFLKSLLNDNDASYQSPEFDSTIIHW
ncbi:1532_t:CDS:2 [Gigaspora margarita]|uniref:1532_t:CDS:1 n=1 Tax=Gigaspora margarita TaxID=4874 RepID=A0ABM8VXJ8_GIGMA|nr:1532_t:CDS:2 [Gigaspora margarita]